MRAALIALAACAPAVQDAVPETHDTSARPAGDGYVFVARRSGASVGLAEARSLDQAEAAKATEHLADGLASCLAGQASRGKLQAGAVRVVAEVDAGGVVGSPRVTLSPGAEATGLLCVVAPFRMLQFSAGPGARGLAIEASWEAR